MMTEQAWPGGAASIALLAQTRRLTASAVDGLTDDQLLEVPRGRRTTFNEGIHLRIILSIRKAVTSTPVDFGLKDSTTP